MDHDTLSFVRSIKKDHSKKGENMKKNIQKNIQRSAGLLLLMAIVISLMPVSAAKQAKASAKSASGIYSIVEEAYDSSFPLDSANEIKTPIKNVFGGYSTVLGVSTKYISSYKAAKAGNTKMKKEYVCFICKASSKKNVKKIKKALKSFVSDEKEGNKNYFDAAGMSLLDDAKVGSKGKYVYLFILDTSDNSKAVKAFKGCF